MFKDTLQSVVKATDGGLAAMVMDFEGIPLETFTEQEIGLDIEIVGAEASVLVKSIQRATEMLDAGETQEVSFKSDRVVTLIRVINEHYFFAVTLAPGGNVGKARYLMRVAAPDLDRELSA